MVFAHITILLSCHIPGWRSLLTQQLQSHKLRGLHFLPTIDPVDLQDDVSLSNPSHFRLTPLLDVCYSHWWKTAREMETKSIC